MKAGNKEGEEGEKLCFLIITEYHPRVGCCSHGLCHFGEAAGNNLFRNTLPRALILNTLGHIWVKKASDSRRGVRKQSCTNCVSVGIQAGGGMVHWALGLEPHGAQWR